jgi:hypothetical protein
LKNCDDDDENKVEDEEANEDIKLKTEDEKDKVDESS